MPTDFVFDAIDLKKSNLHFHQTCYPSSASLMDYYFVSKYSKLVQQIFLTGLSRVSCGHSQDSFGRYLASFFINRFRFKDKDVTIELCLRCPFVLFYFPTSFNE